MTNYADDTTPYDTVTNIESLLNNLLIDSSILLIWFENNYFKLNADKCKLLVTNQEDNVSVNVGDETIVGEKSVKLLGVRIDNHLDFSEHISNICKKADLKMCVLARVPHLMKRDKLRVLMKAFIDTQFAHCPLIWMYHSRTLNNKIN